MLAYILGWFICFNWLFKIFKKIFHEYETVKTTICLLVNKIYLPTSSIYHIKYYIVPSWFLHGIFLIWTYQFSEGAEEISCLIRHIAFAPRGKQEIVWKSCRSSDEIWWAWGWLRFFSGSQWKWYQDINRQKSDLSFILYNPYWF